jgi:hypothetical protein
MTAGYEQGGPYQELLEAWTPELLRAAAKSLITVADHMESGDTDGLDDLRLEIAVDPIALRAYLDKTAANELARSEQPTSVPE